MAAEGCKSRAWLVLWHPFLSMLERVSLNSTRREKTQTTMLGGPPAGRLAGCLFLGGLHRLECILDRQTDGQLVDRKTYLRSRRTTVYVVFVALNER